MASSEVDQKFLGHFAKSTENQNPLLSSMLFKVLGLSVLLSRKLRRARRMRRLDTSRDTKSIHLYHNIIWLAREGLTITEQYILPMIEPYIELRVLSYKLRASFYHIYVLFHNQPSINQAAPKRQDEMDDLTPEGLNVMKSKSPSERGSIGRTPTPAIRPVHRTANVPVTSPPGLPIPPPASRPTASFLLPAIDYTPRATACFDDASLLAETLLPGSHPIRLSVKLEYVAYIYDCLHDGDASRKLAKQTIAAVYNAQEGMDDESFEDAAELVRLLGKMMKRGLGGGPSSGGSGTGGSRFGGGSSSTPMLPQSRPATTSPQTNGALIPPAPVSALGVIPPPGITNPI